MSVAEAPEQAEVAASTPQRVDLIFYGCVLGCVIFGVVLLERAMRDGVGVSPDSTEYVMGARNLLAGKGVGAIDADGEYHPMTHFPPLYMLILAAGNAIVGDLFKAAYLIDLTVFAINLVLVALIVRRCTGYGLAGVAVAMFAACCYDLLQVHGMVWSEGPFLTFTLASWLFLVRYVQEERRRWLVISAIFAALSLLTRYSAIPLIAAAAVALFRPNRKGLRDVAVFMLIACAPLLMWFGRNITVAGNAANRELAVHWPKAEDWDLGKTTVASWLGLDKTQRQKDWALWIASAAVVLAVVGHLASRGVRATQVSPLPFAVIYGLFLIASVTFADAHTRLDVRILAPLHLALLMFVVCSASGAIVRWMPEPWMHWLTTALVVTLLVMQIVRATQWVRIAPLQWMGWTSRAWQQSDLLAYVNRMPADARIYSNATDLLYLKGNRLARPIPKLINPSTGRPIKGAGAAIERMRTDLVASKGYVVFFSSIHRAYLPRQSELEKTLGLKKVYQGGDGAIYVP